MQTLIRLLICCTFIFLSLSNRGSAGVGTSGGGHVILCTGRDADALGSVTLLDLYEAKHVFNLSLRAKRESLEAELQLLAGQLQTVLAPSPYLPRPLTGESLLEWWENRVQYIPKMRAETSDFGVIPTIPKSCSVHQVAVFDDAHEVIQVNLDMWDNLDDFNKAALIAHELIYHVRRLSDRELSSQISRFLVGRIFSTEALSDSESMVSEFHSLHPVSLRTLGSGL